MHNGLHIEIGTRIVEHYSAILHATYADVIGNPQHACTARVTVLGL